MKRFKTLSRKQKIIILLIVVTVVACAVWIFNSLQQKAPNRAEEIVRPIDTALIAAGAVRKCETIAGGQHIASRAVGSTSHYEIKKSREETKELVYRVARENGYDPVQATPENRIDELGTMNDESLSNWIFDDKTKTNNYPELEEGKIILSIGMNNDIDGEFQCATNSDGLIKILGNEEQTVVILATDLPDLRREYRK
jgi:hypothetical protein